MMIGRIVCAVWPFGEPEDVIKNTMNTNSIIGYDQFRRLKRVLPEVKIEFFDKATEYDSSDVLLIMSSVYVIPIEVLRSFKKVVYFYDDVGVIKAQSEQFSVHLDQVGLVLHPEPSQVSSLNSFWTKPTHYMPWSSASVSTEANAIVKRRSIFVDINPYPFAAQSVEFGANFIRSLRDMDVELFVPAAAIHLLPEDVSNSIREVPRMPHQEFLEFIGGMMFYASGIYSSYEYIVMEAALLGCGLISLYGAVLPVHRNRACVLDYKGEDGISDKISEAISTFDQANIIATSKLLYPLDAVSKIPAILEATF